MWVIPEDLGNFSPKKEEKSWGAKIHIFRRRIFLFFSSPKLFWLGSQQTSIWFLSVKWCLHYGENRSNLIVFLKCKIYFVLSNQLA